MVGYEKTVVVSWPGGVHWTCIQKVPILGCGWGIYCPVERIICQWTSVFCIFMV